MSIACNQRLRYETVSTYLGEGMFLVNQLSETSSLQPMDAHGKTDETLSATSINSLDQLKYMADMIDELRTIAAAQTGLSTLTGLLAVAAIESSVQIKARQTKTG